MVVGRSGLQEPVHRSSLRFAPLSCVSNHAPPSSAYLPPSSATPHVIVGVSAAASRVVVCAAAVPVIAAMHAATSAQATASFVIDFLSVRAQNFVPRLI